MEDLVGIVLMGMIFGIILSFVAYTVVLGVERIVRRPAPEKLVNWLTYSMMALGFVVGFSAHVSVMSNGGYPAMTP